MNYINITKPDRDIITLGYIHEADSNVFTFENDIEINGWIINKTIVHGGPKQSTYKYCWENYLEFVITDINDVKCIKRYHYNGGNHNDGVGVYATQLEPIQALAYFIEKATIFKCENWAEFEAQQIILKIREIVSSNKRYTEQIQSIKRFLQ